MERDGEERFERVLDRSRMRVLVPDDVDEREDDVSLRSDDGAVRLLRDQEAVDRGGGGLDGGGGGGGVVVAERVGERVEKAARGHEGFAGGDGEVEEGGGGVLLGGGGGGVESLGEVGDGAGVGDDGAAVGVLFGDESELG